MSVKTIVEVVEIISLEEVDAVAHTRTKSKSMVERLDRHTAEISVKCVQTNLGVIFLYFHYFKVLIIKMLYK